MIQRIQSLWFLLAAGAALLSLKLSFFSGNKIVDNAKQFARLTGASSFLLIILTVAIAVASMILVFLYKDRGTQKGITLLVILASIGNIIYYFYLSKKDFIPGEGNYDFTAIIVFLVPVLLFLAFRGIWKDQKLVKSVDRLRN